MGNRARWARPWMLDELARQEETRKSQDHGYTVYPYPIFLEPIRYLPISFLEIGVKEGNSIRMWDRFFMNLSSRLYCLDIDPNCGNNLPSRWKFFAADQMDLSALPVDGLDVVVDDGAHTTNHNLAAFNSLWPKLNRGGFYIIEDLIARNRWRDVAGKIMVDYQRKFSEFHLYGECLIVKKDCD